MGNRGIKVQSCLTNCLPKPALDLKPALARQAPEVGKRTPKFFIFGKIHNFVRR